MLLFILKSVFTGETETCFNTSHVTLYLLENSPVIADIPFQYITCYSLSSRQRTRFLVWSVSIHHMLLFIGSGKSLHCAKMMFQYITCYSLSNSRSWNQKGRSFQYITCYSLSGRIRSYELPRGVSIHHMLLFIRVVNKKVLTNTLFQYITCYSLSGKIRTASKPVLQFQYITCYSLSKATRGLIALPDKFQYITCYSLSGP